jgi:cytochrome b involved in lipid metabolism
MLYIGIFTAFDFYFWTETKKLGVEFKKISQDVYIAMKEACTEVWKSVKDPSNVIKYSIGALIIYLPIVIQSFAEQRAK